MLRSGMRWDPRRFVAYGLLLAWALGWSLVLAGENAVVGYHTLLGAFVVSAVVLPPLFALLLLASTWEPRRA